MIEEDGGRSADDAVIVETRGNWAVLQRALALAPSNRLRPIQVAGAYQLAALALNGLLRAALDAVEKVGRVALATVRARIAERAGSGFEATPAAAWAGHRRAVAVAEDVLLAEGLDWAQIGARAAELLLRVTLDDRCLRWLTDSPTPMVERLLEWRRDAGTSSAGAMFARLLPDLIEHHAEVSARKGKGHWIEMDGKELVRNDPRPLRLMLHSLRFAQLQQLAADLKLRPEDVVDEA
jgi:hypothetical protein